MPERSTSASATSRTSRRRTATSRWCSRTTRSIRTSRSPPTSASRCGSRRCKKAERERRVREVAELLGLDEYLERKPGQLSGGQRQRVAMGRAIVRQPSVFLMDEPLSNLDAKLRVQMRGDIAALQAALGTTTVYVTHDQAEAMTLGPSCRGAQGRPPPAVRRAARVVRRGPANTFVAGFIGSPAMNLCTVPWGSNAPCRSAASGSGLGGGAPAADEHRGSVVGMRPEALDLAADGLAARVEVVEELGADAYVFCVAEVNRRSDEVRRARRRTPRPRSGRARQAAAVRRRRRISSVPTPARGSAHERERVSSSPTTSRGRASRVARSSSAATSSFTAGQVGERRDAAAVVVRRASKRSRRQALDNIRACLAAAGCGLADVIKVNAFLADLGNFDGLNEVYREYFTEPYPARTTVGAALPRAPRRGRGGRPDPRSRPRPQSSISSCWSATWPAGRRSATGPAFSTARTSRPTSASRSHPAGRARRDRRHVPDAVRGGDHGRRRHRRRADPRQHPRDVEARTTGGPARACPHHRQRRRRAPPPRPRRCRRRLARSASSWTATRASAAPGSARPLRRRSSRPPSPPPSRFASQVSSPIRHRLRLRRSSPRRWRLLRTRASRRLSSRSVARPACGDRSELGPTPTEYRAGTYAFHDRATVAAGAATIDEVAMTVLATVISCPAPGKGDPRCG